MLGAASVGLGQTYIYAATFDACWLLATNGSASIRREIFLRLYGLEAGTIPCGEDCEIDVYFMDLSIWAGIYAFSLTDAAACLGGCKVKDFSG